MQQSTAKPYPVIFDSADKRLRFGITDVGEFLDSAYREQQSSKFFSTMIGRQHIEPHAKAEFTTADVVCEGYLFKKGSWMKNWKKRYFIVRKDIRALCYYASREDLILLGSIPLDIDTRISNVQGEDADGFSHVVAIEADQEGSAPNKTYIRFESFEKMKAWMLDILNEAQSFATTDEDQVDWWTALFGNVAMIEPKTNSSRRDGLVPVNNKDEDQYPPQKPRSITSIDKSTSGAGTNSTAGVDNSGNGSGKLVVDALIQHHEKESTPDSDDDTDPEDNKPTSPLSPSKTAAAGHHEPSSTDGVRSARISANSLQMNSAMERINKKIKHLKQEKPPGLPPFEKANAERFETPQGALAGLQISLRLCNICGFQDRLFVVIFGSLQPLSNTTEQSAAAATVANMNTPGGNAKKSPNTTSPALLNTQTMSRWEQLCRTELRTVKQRLSYSESSLNDVKIHFNVVESLIPDTYKSIRIVVYRQENDTSGKDGKGADLNMQLEIARTAIPRKIFELRSVLKIKMKVKSQPPMDITVPLVKDPEVLVGLVKMTSYDLYNHRNWIHRTMNIAPYAEKMYSFSTSNGMTMTIEQLYASRYSTNTAQALLSLWSAERQDYLEVTIQLLKDHFSFHLKEEEARLRANAVVGEVIEDKLLITFEPMRQAIEAIEEAFHEAQIITALSLDTVQKACQGEEVKNNVIAVEAGGGILRRSAWKKITAWQYVATNLNLHLLSSKYFSFSEIHSLAETEGSNRSLHFVPSITLGCPAAHELKFHDGGLRRMLADIPNIDQKLLWMHALQYPTIEPLRQLFDTFPKEALSLFGLKCSFNPGEELAMLLKKKFEISRRIDIVSSQALSCALTSIRTVLMLAATGSASFLDVLGRSLRIGFLVMFQSMLSTQGAELGMIEDLDSAALWLSLVTVRLVTKPHTQSSSMASSPSGSAINTLSVKLNALEVTEGKEEKQPVFVGKSEDVSCRRDSVTGRLIVDMEISPREAAMVLDALNYMNTFEQRFINPCFSSNPSVSYAQGEVAPRIYAVVEVIGLAFSQGVNEMQTLANLSSSRDVLKQVEINQSSLARMKDYFRSYRDALDYQLVRYTPDMVDALSSAQGNGAGGASRQPSPTPSRQSLSPQPPAASNTAGAVGMGPKRRKSYMRPSLNNAASININHEALNAAVSLLKAKVLGFNDRLLDQLTEAINLSQQTPHEKHVDILLKSSALCRQIAGNISILCKSGKDRTGMGVTLEQTRSLVEDLGVINAPDICQLMRYQGVRRMNVYANTGQTMFAFNQIQRRALPPCYRPPPGCHAGNVCS